MIRENGKIYVAEWLYPQKEKKRLENEIKKIDTYIEEDKNQLKYYQNLLSHPKEDPFSTALPEDRKRNIQHHEESIKKLEVRKENIKQQLSKEEKVKEKPEPKEIKKEEIRLIKFDKDSRVLREEIKSLSEHLPYLEGKEKEKIENAINQRKKEIEDKKETKK